MKGNRSGFRQFAAVWMSTILIFSGMGVTSLAEGDDFEPEELCINNLYVFD